MWSILASADAIAAFVSPDKVFLFLLTPARCPFALPADLPLPTADEAEDPPERLNRRCGCTRCSLPRPAAIVRSWRPCSFVLCIIL